MKKSNTKNRLSILNEVAWTLNACGKTVVFSYDICASGMGKMYDVAKKTPGASKKLFRLRQKGVLKSKESTQLLKKMEMVKNKLNELYRELRRKSIDAKGPVDPSISKEIQSLLADIKDIKSKIDQLNERVVGIEERKTEEVPLEKELKAEVVQKEEPEKAEATTEERQEAPETAGEDSTETGETVLDKEALSAVELGKIRCEAAVNLLKEVLKFEDPKRALEIINSLVTVKKTSGEDITFDLQAEGRKLAEEIESVRSRVQETKVSGAPVEAMQKEEETRTKKSPAVIDEVAAPEKELQETTVEVEVLSEEKPPEPVSAHVKTAKPKVPFSKTIDLLRPSRSRKVTFDEERLKKMVKPQLISLCKDLNIECDYMETKARIIARILEH